MLPSCLLSSLKPPLHMIDLYLQYVNFAYMQNLQSCENLFATHSHVPKFFGTKSYINPLV